MTEEIPGTLKPNEPHPMAYSALEYIKDRIRNHENPYHLIEALASTAMSGNRVGEVCGETLRRILDCEPVSDRYTLGLAWMLKEMEEHDAKKR